MHKLTYYSQIGLSNMVLAAPQAPPVKGWPGTQSKELAEILLGCEGASLWLKDQASYTKEASQTLLKVAVSTTVS